MRSIRRWLGFNERPRGQERAYDLNDVQRSVEEGRRLAIYDRGTRLYAYWYLALRGQEELERARRYRRQLSMVSIWASDPASIGRVARMLEGGLRPSDLAGYLNNGHFVVLLIETDALGASIVLDRLSRQIGRGVEAAVVSYPHDAETFDALLELAKSKVLPDDGRRSA